MTITISEFIKSDLQVDYFSDTNLKNYLTNNKEDLCAEGKYFVKDTLNCLDPDTKILSNIYKKIGKIIFPPESLDPKENYLPKNYFVPTTVYRKVSSILDDLIDEEEIRFIASARDTGKTLSQNIWIKENDTELEKRNIFWVRCDCVKLMKLIGKFGYNKIDKIKEDIIENYFDIQFLSVLCKNYNSEKRPFFQQIIQELNEEIIYLRISGDNKTPIDEKEPTLILDVINSYHDIILAEKRNKGKPHFNYGRDVVLQSSLGEGNKIKVFDNWKRVSKKIQGILIGRGYRFLRIIDSIDNFYKFDIAGEYRDEYRFIIDKIISFCDSYNDDEKISKEGSVAIICRKNTFWEFLNRYPDTKDRDLQKEFFNHDLIKFEGEEKERDKHSIHGKRYELIDQIIKENIDSSNLISDELLKIYEKTFNYTAHNHQFLFDFLKADKHIGYLLHNKYSFVPTLFHSKKKYDIQENDLDNFLDNFIKHNFPSNLLLNGCFSLNSFARKRVMVGGMLFNIFYYEEVNNANEGFNWQGLCSTRILQYLQNVGAISKNDLVDIIHKLFCYDENEIKIKLSKLIEFSLLQLTESKEYSENDKRIFNNPQINITDKGKASLNLVYSDLDILYHCSLDTLMPTSLIEKSFILPHSNEMRIKNYSICCLKSALSFIQYLKYIDRKERAYINKLDSEIDPQHFILPFNTDIKVQDYLVKRAKNLESSLKDDTLNEFQEFINSFKEPDYDVNPKNDIGESMVNQMSETTKNSFKLLNEKLASQMDNRIRLIDALPKTRDPLEQGRYEEDLKKCESAIIEFALQLTEMSVTYSDIDISQVLTINLLEVCKRKASKVKETDYLKIKDEFIEVSKKIISDADSQGKEVNETEMFTTAISSKDKLELTIPIIPLFLNYKKEFSFETNLNFKKMILSLFQKIKMNLD